MRHSGRLVRATGVAALAGTLFLVTLAQVGAQPVPGWLPGPSATGTTIDGYIDVPGQGATVITGTPLRIGGWAVDRTAQGWSGIDDIQVWIGKLLEGGTLVGRASFGACPASGDPVLCRNDVALALNNPFFVTSGFFVDVPASTLIPGAQVFNLYVHSPGKGWWYKSVSVNVVVGAPAPAPSGTGTGAIPVLVVPDLSSTVHARGDEITVRGYALDPAATSGTGIDRIEVYVEGPRGVGTPGGTARVNLPSGDGCSYGARFCSAGFEVDISTSGLDNGSREAWVYARSSVTGSEAITKTLFRLGDNASE